MSRHEFLDESGSQERRMFVIDGRLTPNEWQLVTSLLGECAAAWGITLSEVEQEDHDDAERPFSEVLAASTLVGEQPAYTFGQREPRTATTLETVAMHETHEAYAGPTASREDFFRFGKAAKITNNVAGRAWSSLTHVYSVKVNSAALKGEYTWYDNNPERFKDSPLIFEENATPIQKGESYREYEAKLSGLRIDSLARLLEMIAAAPPENKNAHIHNLLGRHTGPSTVKFLRLYLANRQDELDAWRASQASEASETSETSEA